MDTPSVDGAIAAATYVTQIYAYSWATGDLSLWSSISGPTCELCARVSGDIGAMTAAGNSSTSAPIDVVQAEGTEISAGRWYSADLEIVQGASQLRGPDQAVIANTNGGPARFFVALSWVDDRWLVEAADFLPSELSP